MLFAVTNIDKPNSLELRQATRPTHLAYLQFIVSKIYMAGPVLDAQGNPKGSLLILEAADEEEVRALAAGDPYAQAGLFESVTIMPYRATFEKYKQIG
ncbi:MAG TPA: YciI family protein [Stellaceae bacterium]|jgi:uncharacterized protein YciI|nr:YciI family protein [Stellaceae bacterium]